MSSFFKTNWKFLLALLAVLVLAAFCAVQWTHSVREEAPDWMRQRVQKSPSKWFDSRVRRSWKPLEQLVENARRESKRWAVPVGSIQFLSVRDGEQTISWDTEMFHNPGFAPMTRFESINRTEESRFIGFYSLDGVPLTVTLKRNPRAPGALFKTVHLAEPLAPGATALVFRVEQRLTRSARGSDGQYQYQFRWMPPPRDAIYATGVALPASAKTERYVPTSGTVIDRSGDPVTVFWINSLLETPALPPSLAFRLSN